MSNQESVEKLKTFKNLVSDYFDGKYEDQRKLKSEINYLLPMVQTLVTQANCLKIMTMAPPPAIGGGIIQNFNPFDMIFTEVYGMSVIPDIVDMVDQSIGKYKNNLVGVEHNEKKEKKFRGGYPEKITLQWLFEHVPLKIWIYGIGLLISVFALGYKFCELTKTSIT